jgi:hypothetical protein
MLVRNDRPARKHGVTVLSMARKGIGAVNGGVAFGRKKICLWHIWPMGKVPGFSAVHLPYFLQADDVCIKLLHRVPEVLNFQSPGRPDALHALMNVVRCHS